MSDLATQFLALSEDRRRRMTAGDVPADYQAEQARIVSALHGIYGSERGMGFSKSVCPDGFGFFIDVVKHLAAAARPIRYLEIGSFEGVSMSVVASLLRRHGLLNALTSVDPYYADGYIENHPVNGAVKSTSSEITMQSAMSLYQTLGFEVEHLRAESQQALCDLLRADRRFDLIYIDGLHRGIVPTIDFGLSMCLLATDGVLVLDDWAWPDVIGLKQVCDRSMRKIAECPDIAAYVTL